MTDSEIIVASSYRCCTLFAETAQSLAKVHCTFALCNFGPLDNHSRLRFLISGSLTETVQVV